MGALLRSGAAIQVPDDAGPGTKQDVFEWRAWQSMSASPERPVNWEVWLDQARRADNLRNTGTAGFLDQQFNAVVDRFMDRHNAPPEVREVIRFRRALASWNFADAAASGARLMELAANNRAWISGDELRDGLVMARLHLRDARGARQALDSLFFLSRRPATDVRSQLLTAYVQTAERLQSVVLKR
jgi:hypothetical protein